MDDVDAAAEGSREILPPKPTPDRQPSVRHFVMHDAQPLPVLDPRRDTPFDLVDAGIHEGAREGDGLRAGDLAAHPLETIAKRRVDEADRAHG